MAWVLMGVGLPLDVCAHIDTYCALQRVLDDALHHCRHQAVVDLRSLVVDTHGLPNTDSSTWQVCRALRTVCRERVLTDTLVRDIERWRAAEERYNEYDGGPWIPRREMDRDVIDALLVGNTAY